MRLHTSHRTHESELAREGEEDEADPPARERLPRRMAEAPDGDGGADASPATSAAMLRFADAIHAGVHEARGSAPEHAAGRAVAEADTSGGASVPAHLAARFARAGHDVSGVRLHAGASSTAAARSVSARAYAHGQHVHFAEGEYAPGTARGDHLIAHEVAHTVQQRGQAAAPQLQLANSHSGDTAEREADAVADAVAGGGAVPAITAHGAGIARWADASTAQTIQRLIDRAPVDQLSTIRTALGDAEGSAERLVPLDIPGYAGYVAHDDIRPLFQRAARRLDALAPAERAERGEVPWWIPALTGRGMRPAQAGRDAATRIDQYVRPARELSQRVMADVQAGRITAAEGAEIASRGRTALRTQTRDAISPASRAVSEVAEPADRTIGELVDYYAVRALRRDARLRDAFGITEVQRGEQATEVAISAMRESEDVQRAIIEGAGRTNRWVTGGARFMRVAGPVMMAGQLVVSGYRVLSEDEGDRMYAAGEELSGFSGGTLGAAAGGVVVATLGAFVVGLGVTVAAPVAIVIGFAIVGGMAWAGDSAARSVWDRHVDRAAMRDAELDLGRAIDAWSDATVGARIAAATMPVSPFAAGGGFRGLMERDRREHGITGPRPPETSGGEAP